MIDDKIAVIHQPDFMPYIGFFHKLLNVDKYVILDDVQFLQGNRYCWHNRDKIKTPYGAKWMTVSVEKGHSKRKINEVRLSQVIDWKTKNLNQLKSNYKKAEYFDEVFPYVKAIYQKECNYLSEFNYYIIDMLINLFDIKIDILWNSQLPTEGKKNDLIVNILEYIKCSKYLSGIGAKDYYEAEIYEKAGIEVIWQDFKHPIYPQLYGDFTPYLSSIDLLFNCGIEESRRILREEC